MNNLSILKYNSVYRIGDLFLCNGPRFKKDREQVLNNEVYKNSIMRNYLNNKSTEQDYKCLNDCIKSYAHKHNLNVPSSTELVIHVRLGDIVGNTLHRKSKFSYEKTVELYSDIFSNINLHKHDIKKVTIVTALHFGNDKARNLYMYEDDAKNKSYEIIDNILNQCKNNNYQASILSSNDIDTDFCYMANSSFFKQSLGGFSKIICELVKYNNNITFDL